ncbi:PIN domain-containing protein [Luteolibacter ambystomatis]|uniref:PIN domain-containing protein n=1 Tax=Luteolibacter ambystomatis TaxID=2824561 RepID=A0A975G988_9BACT|nr:PIN domain-containing protein [Luteolibacter ambystomatis]QUE51050.1 PIN domain-containing protein [Luteolibacter ambystomatis]
MLDTNTIVRFVTGEPEKQAVEVAGLVTLAEQGKIRLIVLPMVVAESVFVLNGFYKHPRAAVAEALSHLISSPGFQCSELDRLLRALKLFGVGRLDFVDCYLAAASILEKLPVASFDKDFDKLHGVTRKAPGSFRG